MGKDIDIFPDPINVNAALGGIPDQALVVDLGLDVSGIPDPINVNAVVDLRPVNVNAALGGLPNQPLVVDLRPVAVDLDADVAARVDVGGTGQPVSLEVGGGANPIVLDLGLDNIKIDLGGLDNIKIDAGLDNINACLSLAVTEIPSVRVHLPTKSEFGFSLFGVSVFNFTFKGDMMLITEDNPPRMFFHPEEAAPPSAGRSNLVSSEGGSDVAYTVTLGEEADEI